MRTMYLGAALLLAVVGCVGEKKDADTVATVDTAVAVPAPADTRARDAAVVANAMAANPAAADSILTANGHTRDSFQQLMYDIAADSTASASYASARTTP